LTNFNKKQQKIRFDRNQQKPKRKPKRKPKENSTKFNHELLPMEQLAGVISGTSSG
jgi:hypothetical protein